MVKCPNLSLPTNQALIEKYGLIEFFNRWMQTESDLEVDYSDAQDFIDKLKYDTGLIEGFTGPQQNTIVKFLTANIVTNRKEGVKASKTINDLFTALKEDYDQLVSEGELDTAMMYKKILDKKEDFEKHVALKLIQLSQKTIEQEEDEQDGEENVPSTDSQTQDKNFSKESYEEDPFASTSPRLRSLFFMVEDLDENGEVKTGYLGMPIYKEASEIVPKLQIIASELTHEEITNSEKLAIALQDYIKEEPWLKSIIDLLNDRDKRYWVELSKFLSKHQIKMVTALVDDRGDVTKLKAIDTNQNSIEKETVSRWQSKQTTLPLVSTSKEGDLVIDSTAREKLISEYESLITNPSEEGIINWLKQIGVDLHPNVIRFISEEGKSSKRTDNMDLPTMIKDKKGWFNRMYLTLVSSKGEGENKLSLNNPLFNNPGVRKLARLEAKFNKSATSTSFVNGENKIIATFSNNKYASIQFKRLMEDPAYAQKMLESDFSKNSWFLKMLAENNAQFKDVWSFNYADTIRIQSTNQEAKTLDQCTDAEYELFKLTLFTNNMFLYPTMSDKKAAFIMKSLTKDAVLIFDDNDNFDIANETVDEYFKPLESELQRNEFLQKNGKQNIGGFDNSKNQVLLYFPELNTIDSNDPNFIEGLFSETVDGLITNDTPEVRKALREWLRNKLKNEILNQIEDWKKLSIISDKGRFDYMDRKYINSLSDEQKATEQRSTTQVAANYILNYAVFKHNVMQAFVDDPLFYWKGNIDETWTNVGKRLASENAPGFDMIDIGANTYNQVFISDPKMISRNLDYYRKLGLSESAIKTYQSIDGTDAQEYTTLKEHLYVMYHTGRLSKSDYERLSAKAERGIDYTPEEIGILQPHKPVYRETLVENHLNRPVYIKTSSFPLIPQLTRGLNIDRIRVAMESRSIDRLVLKSGAKVGLPGTLSSIFDSEGNIAETIDFKDSSIKSLPRTGLRIQQEVPYDSEKSKINTVTQADKLITADLPEELNPVVQKYFELKRELYKLHFSSFEKEFELKEGPGGYTFNIKKLSDALIKEGIQRNYSPNDLKSLEVKDGKFVVPLFFNNSGLKVQNALMSIMDKRLRKLKMPGFSGILGAEAGFETVKGWEELTDKQKSDIVFINKKHEGLAHNEILVPFKFRNSEGELMNVKDFVKKDGTLDTERVPEELLKLLGFRIPNQGKNSMISLKIAGFLPTYMGDLVIASRDLTKQMGSDFDVDKLYMYMYNTVYNEITGKLSRYTKDPNIEEEEDDSEFFDEETEELSELIGLAEKKALKRQIKGREPEIQNEIIDCFHEILNNEEVLKQVKEPLGFGKLEDVKKEILSLKPKSILSPLSPMYDRKKYLSARGGKAGTGVYSVSNTLNSVLQGKDIYIQTLEEDENGKLRRVENFIYFTSRSNKLSDTHTNSGVLKSNVHAAFQSAAVDEEKEQLLSNLNINSFTFDVTTGAIQLGFDEEEIAYLINQPIILEYIQEVVARSSTLTEGYDPNIKETVFLELSDKYSKLANYEYVKTDLISLDELKKGISQDETVQDYHKTQLLALNKFVEFRSVGENVRQLASSINSDSKGLPKDIIELVNKVEQIKGLSKMMIHNAEFTLGRVSDTPREGYVKIDEDFYLYPTTIPGMSAAYALGTAYQTYKNLVPYESPDFKNITDWITTLSGKELNTPFKKGNFTRNLTKALKSYYYSLNDLGLYREDVQLLRERLLLGENSLAKRILDFQGRTQNKFIRRMVPVLSTDGGPDTISFNAATRETLDESELHRDFAQLFIDESTRSLAEDLVAYSYVTGGIQEAKQFIKYVPFSYLQASGTVTKLNELNNKLFGSRSVDSQESVFVNGLYPFVPDVVLQLVQTYPEYSTRIPSLKQLKRTTKDNGKIVSFDPIPETLYLSGDKKGFPKELVHIKDNGVLIPFQYNSTIKRYVRLEKLADFPIQEYNANGQAKTQYPKNKVNITVPIDNGSKLPTPTVKLPNPLAQEFKLFESGLKEGVLEKSFLDYIANGADKYHAALAQVLIENYDKLSNTTIRFDKSSPFRGSYDYRTGILVLNPEKMLSGGESAFKGTVIEELFHALTTKALREPKTEKEIKISKAITSLREFVKEKLRETHGEKFGEFESKISNNRTTALTKEEVDLFYGTFNNQEFIAQAFRRPEFQKLLNSIPYDSSGKTLLERLVELIKLALTNIGVEIKPNSALDAAVNEMFKLLEKEEVKPQEKKKVVEGDIQVKRVISGGQHGGDMGGLKGARKAGIETGGTAPPGFVQYQRGNQKELLTSYGLVEGEADPYTYPKRTMKNVDNSDGTVAILWGPSAGTEKTIGYAQTHKWQAAKESKFDGYKPVLVIKTKNLEEAKAQLSNFLKFYNINVLNVAGHRESSQPGIEDFTEKLIYEVLHKTIEPKEEISSNSKAILGALTNPTELAKSKGNITQSYPVEFRGKTYKDAEEAYQKLKGEATKDDGPNSTYNLMIDIIKAKLEQHPKLTEEITKLGGSKWILSKTHQPTNKNTVWETGGKNWFIKALNEAYIKAIESKIETTTSPIYKDGFGNFYKFDLNKDNPDVMVKGYYSQGTVGNWKEMSDKTAKKKFYDEFETLSEVVNNPTPIQTQSNKIVINGIELNTGNIILNIQQAEALQSFANFMDAVVSEGWENTTYSLQGYAGTGKTTITRFIVQYLKKKGKNYALSSPTHRAKEVLQDLTGEKAMTVAKVLGLSPGVDVENFNLVDKQFESKNEIKIPYRGVLIVDEASMVNDALFNKLVDLSAERGTKVLFVGDDAQLKPVKQKDKGKAFRRDTNISKLTQVMRTEDGNPMPAEVLQPIRDNPSSNVDMFEHENKLSSKGEGIIFVKDNKEWTDSLLEKMSLEKLHQNPNFVRALAYTNKRVRELNNMIRTKMFGIGAEDFYVGELLMMYENLFFLPGGDYVYPNGMDVKVESIQYRDNHEIAVPGTNRSVKVAGYFINTSRTKTGNLNPKPLFIADIDKVSSEYMKELVDLKNKALTAPSSQRGMAWAQFFEFSSAYNLIDEVYFLNDIAYNSRVEAGKVAKQMYPSASQAQLELVLNKAKAKDKSVDYAYAHTIHKSQGGTYDYAYVDEGNIDMARSFQNADHEMVNQLKYVGFSRSSKLTVSLTQKAENSNIVETSSLSLPTEQDLKESIKKCKL